MKDARKDVDEGRTQRRVVTQWDQPATGSVAGHPATACVDFDTKNGSSPFVQKGDIIPLIIPCAKHPLEILPVAISVSVFFAYSLFDV